MNTNTNLKIGLFTILVVGIVAVGLSMNKTPKPSHIPTISNVDSLHNVIDSLQTEIFILEDGFDSKEHRYEDIIFEYELGISYLKDYHPTAYKDFHRIIGMRERYTTKLEKENNKRLKANDL